jgi:plasmid stability protein
MQYTLRNIPETLDAALRERARASGKSLNQAAVEALCRGLGFSQEVLRHRDLTNLAGTWKNDPAFDRAIVDQHAIDEELWK